MTQLHDPSLDDQPRPDEQDRKVLDNIIAAIDEDPDLFNDWERKFLRSINRQTMWTSKQCEVYDKLTQSFQE